MATAPRFAVAPPIQQGQQVKSLQRGWDFVRAHLLLIALAIGASLFVVYVWPTQYRYEHVSFGRYTLLVRIDRFTGQPEYLLTSGWSRTIRYTSGY